MSIVRSYADRDTWINESATAANFGLSPVLEVWNRYDNVKEKKELARILIRFSLTGVENDIKNKNLYPDPRVDNSVSAYIYMFNTPHGDVQASDFTIDAFPLTGSWIEGDGVDFDKYSHTGFANTLFADSVNRWEDIGAGTGGEAYLGHHNRVYDSNSASMYFTHGEENLKLDVTSWFKEYLDGSSSNNGFLIRMSDREEAQTDAEATAAGVPTSVTAVSFFTKKFYGRETNTRLRPYLQLEWPGAIKDDRRNINFSKTGNLFFYNYNDGVLEDLNGTGKFPGFVSLSANGNQISPNNLTASRVSTGIYKINIGTAKNHLNESLTGINISLSSSTSFTDSWVVTADGYHYENIFNFNVTSSIGNNSFVNTSNFQANLMNAKSEYDYGSIANIRVFIKDRGTRLTTLTGSSTALQSFVAKNSYVEIREKATDMIEIPQTELSYDETGNYFSLNTNNLYPGIEYKVVLKLNIRGESFIIDEPEKWNFIVK
tara:strand:- start:2071 stop:3534 length:1464 start_codon:yes stop_codon:yes gene_type:complete